jgi:hypothetical protein
MQPELTPYVIVPQESYGRQITCARGGHVRSGENVKSRSGPLILLRRLPDAVARGDEHPFEHD